MRKSLVFAAAAVAAGMASGAHAGIIDLTFDGIAPTYPFFTLSIDSYYNGGLSSIGTTGPNYGVSFPNNALNVCLNSMTVDCSGASKGGLGPANSREGGLIFISGRSMFMDVAAGFGTGFSFDYVSLSESGSVTVWSGLDGTGTLLATIDLSPNAGSCPGYTADYCPFSAKGVSFAGTARSVDFAGAANSIVFDDVTLGSPTPGIPEPSTWTMMALAFAGLAFAGCRKSVGGEDRCLLRLISISG
jgi:hypothetical protein